MYSLPANVMYKSSVIHLMYSLPAHPNAVSFYCTYVQDGGGEDDGGEDDGGEDGGGEGEGRRSVPEEVSMIADQSEDLLQQEQLKRKAETTIVQAPA